MKTLPCLANSSKISLVASFPHNVQFPLSNQVKLRILLSLFSFTYNTPIRQYLTLKQCSIHCEVCYPSVRPVGRPLDQIRARDGQPLAGTLTTSDHYTSHNRVITPRGAKPCRLLKKLEPLADLFWLSELHVHTVV